MKRGCDLNEDELNQLYQPDADAMSGLIDKMIGDGMAEFHQPVHNALANQHFYVVGRIAHENLKEIKLQATKVMLGGGSIQEGMDMNILNALDSMFMMGYAAAREGIQLTPCVCGTENQIEVPQH